jgi:hypothetical protein
MNDWLQRSVVATASEKILLLGMSRGGRAAHAAVPRFWRIGGLADVPYDQEGNDIGFKLLRPFLDEVIGK